MSQDDALTEAFRRDEDVHAKTASEVFSIPIEWVTPEQRSQAKAVNFGIVYGISDYGLSRNLGIPVSEARRYIDGYFRLYKGVKRYMDQVVEEARRNGYVTTLLGRRRYLPELNSRSVPRRKFAERTAMNTPIQGSAADIIKVAMVKVDREIQSKGLRSRLLLQVHDELVFEAVEDELDELSAIVAQSMESAADLRVPLKVDINVGSNWKEAK
jgi:DNA polymerase-1